MIPSHFLEIETVIDANGSLAKECNWPEILPLLHAFQAGDWEEVQARAEALWPETKTCEDKAFLLQWAVAASEIKYDLPRRAKWIAKWEDIPGRHSVPYCKYLRLFHEGLTLFFSAYLNEAELRFMTALDLAEKLGYERGKMRCLFHLGLIFRDREVPELAKEFFLRSLMLAQARDAKSYSARIQVQLGTVSQAEPKAPTALIEEMKREIESHLLRKEFHEARAIWLRAERMRRAFGLGRRRESLHLYAPLFAIARGRNPAPAFRRVNDPILKIKLLQLKERIFGLDRSESEEISALREAHGITRTVRKYAENAVEICGIKLERIKSSDLKSLVTLLLEHSGPVPKTEICRKIWGFEYDPVLHDGRIYKLIHQARTVFRTKELILNTYGGYVLNPKFLGREALVS